MGESIRQALGKHVKILHKVPMKLEKGGGDRTDNRVLVFTPHRLFVMTAKVGFHASWKEEATHLPHFPTHSLSGPTQEMQPGESRVARKKKPEKTNSHKTNNCWHTELSLLCLHNYVMDCHDCFVNPFPKR